MQSSKQWTESAKSEKLPFLYVENRLMRVKSQYPSSKNTTPLILLILQQMWKVTGEKIHLGQFPVIHVERFATELSISLFQVYKERIC